MASYSNAKEMHHPDGSKVLLAYSAEEERDILADFAKYRAQHAEANEAAVEGRDLRPSKLSLTQKGA